MSSLYFCSTGSFKPDVYVLVISASLVKALSKLFALFSFGAIELIKVTELLHWFGVFASLIIFESIEP